MDHFLYIAASGAGEVMNAQAVNAHNMANASTPGFKANLVMAKTAYLSGTGINSRAYASQQDVGLDASAGVLNPTGNNLDVAVNGTGWMVAQAADGGEALTRRGDLRVDEFGQVTNGLGQSLVGNAGPIAIPPYSDIAIGTDGTISIVPLGEDPNTLVVVDRLKLVNPGNDEIEKSLDGLLRMKDDQPSVPDAAVRVVTGSLESSNVNSVEAMVRMIELARQFETQVKVMSTAQQLDRESAQLMRMN